MIVCKYPVGQEAKGNSLTLNVLLITYAALIDWQVRDATLEMLYLYSVQDYNYFSKSKPLLLTLAVYLLRLASK